MSKSASPKHRKSVFDRRFDSKALHLAQCVYLDIGTPTALRLLRCSLGSDHLDIAKARISPTDYSSADEFRKDYLAVSLLQKFEGLNCSVDRESLALQSFLDCESRCAATAKRLKTNYVNGLYNRITPEAIILSAREKIARLLGPFSWDLAESHFRFGPGASVSVPHRLGDAYYKLKEKPSSTYGCAILAYTAIRRIPRWFEHVVSLTGKTPEIIEQMPILDRVSCLFNLVDGNRVTFVPKSALKVRTIAIEPTMNGFIQHGIGAMIRTRLRRVRIGGTDNRRLDLNTQETNQSLARVGSLDGSLATVDLSAASDSVSWGLVTSLLPEDWVDALALTRSPYGTLPDGTKVKYQKVSSMGCGFTFELESLIFWALARAVVDILYLRDRRVSVYGDDIIIPTAAVSTLKWMLLYCGFEFNSDKTFTDGPFRESCGKHYFHGTDVTPLYIRKDIDTVPRLFWFCNQIRRWSRYPCWGLSSELLYSYREGVSLLPRKLRQPVIPDGIGDLGLIGDLDEVCPKRLRDGHDGWQVKTWIPVTRNRRYSDSLFLLRSLGKLDHRSDIFFPDVTLNLALTPWELKRMRYTLSRDGIPIHGSECWRMETLSVADWPSFGPWIE